MSKIYLFDELDKQYFPLCKRPLIVCAVAISLSTFATTCFAQSSSDYHPGAGIKFHDLNSSSSSASSSPSVTSGGGLASSSPSQGGAASSSAPPSSSGSSSLVGASNGSYESITPAAQETGEKGLGSFLKNVVRAGAQVGSVRQSNYGSGRENNYGSGQSFGNYGNASQVYSNPGGGSYSGNYGAHPVYNSSRPDGVQSGNPFPERHSAYDGAQNQARISGTPMELVTNNPPGPVDGDIENLIPKEIHNKAYGPELHRNGPLNGAEDHTHLY